ncbi:hypothetical protein ACJMK2_018858 [Sinanodonta woodiana]|uniref:Transcription factor n=1 Tax=Sinanodonta woodiana TaxID=1069815 RepID=A0ABD3UEX7_SINWO
MANSNTTLASLWDDGQSSPIKILHTSSQNSHGTEMKDEIVRFYKDSGLENVAKEVGIIDVNGDLIGFRDQKAGTKTATIQLVALPISNSPAKMSPYKVDQQLMPRSMHTNQIISTASPRMAGSPQIITAASPHTPILTSDSQWAVRKRQSQELMVDPDFSEGKRSKKGDKGGKGLRHFSMKVCEKVQKKGVTSYNEVADELVAEFSDPRNLSSPSDQAYDQKNIRRRVYDALNVLMAMNIISKEKKEIRWIGLPTNSAQECQNLEIEKQKRLERIRHKKQQLQELILQQIAFKNLVQRNRDLEKTQGPPAPNSAIQLPFIIVNTSKKTVIDCSISKDKDEYLFNFDNTFEIHDDIEVLKRMGMAYGLEKGQCSTLELQKCLKLVPKSLEHYVLDLAKGSMANAGPSGIRPITSGISTNPSQYRPLAVAPHSPLTVLMTGQPGTSSSADAMDIEVAMAIGLSRESSMGSSSDMHSRAATETPSEDFSDDSDDDDGSSPLDNV